MSDKQSLPRPAAAAAAYSSRWKRPLIAGVILSLYLISRIALLFSNSSADKAAADSPIQCPAQAPSLPSPAIPFRVPDGSIERWSESVTYPTISYDDFREPGNDTRYDTFPPFYAFLQRAFPAVHATLSHETVNHYGNLYEWRGSDASLKPLILMAHADVVPVDPTSVDRWDAPPFSGHIDPDGWVHGRGAGDCKNLLLSIYEVIEGLINAGFTPRRTIILSFGFDEEISGPRGAKHLSERIHDKYATSDSDSDIAIAVLDEGGLLDLHSHSTPFALPAVKEKGYLDVKVSVATRGGHSSIPPPHTSIGYLAQLIAHMEAHPHAPHLAVENPFTTHLQCLLEHSPASLDAIDPHLRQQLPNTRLWGEAARTVAEHDVRDRYLIQTSQAADLIAGGVKVNALPEVAFAVFNQRIDVAGSVHGLKEHLTSLLQPYAEELGMAFVGFDGKLVGDAELGVGTVQVEVFGSPLDPAPNTPTSGHVWDTLVGSLRNVFGGDLVVSPHLMAGNTDTRHYWRLTRNIFRFEAFDASLTKDIHTVNERVHKDAHIQSMSFLHQFIQQLDSLDA
ncbi:hypothetical protein E3P89_02783 [Wallemia ichthyophaga]|uniref:Peptidase M20 dimerisation domain-containing protein n=1 Tax=Wallemia ichthyophaga TaxID=245174 RepID=A0A4T0H8U7_WALIC|nr:hypothetical protein E3P90_02799 [Wallemia ichthyophaga]TIB10617.1 hypothetical protein E3P93_02807 [Wallemia ichthyophaga]TIB21141.1 hypothetical protein E3P89_02783 [Wallemia ichthyophaga]TIB22793.1 hypothetical protein E3P88_02818 [Wallemia ichthyophaga]